MKALTVGKLIKLLEKYSSNCEVLVDLPTRCSGAKCINIRGAATSIVIEIDVK